MTSVMSLSLERGQAKHTRYMAGNHVQHPRQATVEFSIYTLQVCNHNLLFQDHLVERDNEVCIQESTMEDAQTETPSNELEVVQVLRIDTRSGVDLEGIVVVGGVFE